MAFKKVVLRLARNPGFPDGDTERGYVVHAPLTADGHLDLDAWRQDREKAPPHQKTPGIPRLAPEGSRPAPEGIPRPGGESLRRSPA